MQLAAIASAVFAAAFLNVAAVAQEDPRLAEGQEAVRAILQRIGIEMEDIDRMLNEASRPADRRETEQPATELLEESKAAQERVARGIDELLDEIEKRQGSGC